MKLVQKTRRFLGQILIVGFVAMVVSCGHSKMDRKDKVASIIGALNDPFIGVTFTPQVLIDKSGMNEGALPFTYQAFAAFFMSEEKTGIDNEAQIQIVVENSGGMVPNGFAFIPLKNSDKFKVLVEKELGAKVQEKDGAYYFRKDEDNYVVAWKDDLAIISNIPLSLDNLFSKGTNESKKVAVRLVNLLNEVSKKNLNKEFRAFFDTDDDFKMYANGQSAYNVIDGMRFISKKDKNELKSLLSGTTIQSALNFENGSIEFDGNFALADSLQAYFDVLNDGGVDDDMLAYGLSDSPIMAMSMNLSPKNFVRLLKKQRQIMDTDGLEKELKSMDLTLDDLENMFSGQVVIIMDGLDSTVSSFSNFDGSTEDYKNYQPKMAVIIGLKDAKKVQELMSLSNSEGIDSNRIDDMYFHFDNNKLILVSNSDWLAAVQNNKTVKLNNGNLTENSVGMYLNTNMDNKLDLDMKELELIQKEMIEMVAKVTDKGVKLSIKLKDANKNALRTILERMVEEFEKQEKYNNPNIEDLLNDELIESIGKEVEAGVEEVINSDELKELINALQ